ncbi:PKD domain-containing protein [Kaarinaea lacus]
MWQVERIRRIFPPLVRHDSTYAGGAGGADAQYDSDAFISHFDMTGNGSDGGSGGGGSTYVDPVTNADSDQTVGPRQNLTLDGSASSDSDGQIVQSHWTQVSGRRVTINNADSAVASFVSSGMRRGRIKTPVFELTVTDDQGVMATDQVTVIVTR